MSTRAIRSMLPFVVWLAAALGPAGAQDMPATQTTRVETTPATMLRDALAGVEPGKYVRIEVGGAQRHEGHYLEVRNDSLCIAQGEWEIAVAARDVRALWTQERATRQGAIAGGITGGVTGAALGALLYALVTSICDTGDCPDYSSGENVVAGLVGALAGGLSGGLAGGVIGAAIPRWVVRYRANEGATGGSADARGDASDESGGRSGIAHARGSRVPYRAEDRRGGYGLAMGSLSGASSCARNGAPYTRLMLHVNLTPRWTLVPEAGFTWRDLAQTSSTICGAKSVSLCESSVSTFVRHLGLAARYSPNRGDTRPYLTVGAGGYAWNESFLGYNLGAGMMFAAKSDHPIELELRYHANLQRLVEECPSRLISLTAGVQVATW
jgi:hypothetical protein